MEDQSFYDPLGYYFNDKGFDEVVGYSSTLKKTVKVTLNIKKIAKSTMMTIILMANAKEIDLNAKPFFMSKSFQPSLKLNKKRQKTRVNTSTSEFPTSPRFMRKYTIFGFSSNRLVMNLTRFQNKH